MGRLKTPMLKSVQWNGTSMQVAEFEDLNSAPGRVEKMERQNLETSRRLEIEEEERRRRILEAGKQKRRIKEERRIAAERMLNSTNLKRVDKLARQKEETSRRQKIEEGERRRQENEEEERRRILEAEERGKQERIKEERRITVERMLNSAKLRRLNQPHSP